MDEISKAISEHEKKCFTELPVKFVHWYWMVLFLVGIIVTVGGGSAYQGSQMSSVRKDAERALEDNKRQDLEIDQLQAMFELTEETNANVKRLVSIQESKKYR